MKYLLFICVEEGIQLSPEDARTIGPASQQWAAEMDRRKVRLTGHQLAGKASAKSVRVRGGARAVTDGPYAETKEQIAGFDIVECRNVEEAIEVASKHPVARFGTVEVRPFLEE